MPKLNELKEQRAAKVAEMETLHAKDRMETADETRFKALETEVRTLNDNIRRHETMAEFERFEERGETVHGTNEQRDMRGYSVAKAIQESLNGRLTGLEAEVHSDLSRGRESRGVMVPTSALLEHRALTTTTPAGGPGGNLVATYTGPLTEHPRPILLTESLGATVMRNLVGNVDLPRLSESGTVHWIAEHANTTRSDPQFAKTQMTPKTVSAEYELSRRLILQSSTAIEDVLRRDLQYLLRQALDGAAIGGAGGLQPTGILNTAGVVTIAGAAVDSDLTADMIAALELDDLTGSRAFLTNPGVMQRARKVKDADGRVIPQAEIFHGERVAVTNQVPSNIGELDDKLALIYGQWSELVIGYWSGVDILANPYHSDVASKGGLLLHAFLDADVAVREPRAFVKAEID